VSFETRIRTTRGPKYWRQRTTKAFLEFKLNIDATTNDFASALDSSMLDLDNDTGDDKVNQSEEVNPKGEIVLPKDSIERLLPY
jgi:hypothetical protein